MDLVEFIPGDYHCLGRGVFAKSEEVNGIDHPDLIQVWPFSFRVLVLVIRDRDIQEGNFRFVGRGWHCRQLMTISVGWGFNLGGAGIIRAQHSRLVALRGLCVQ